MAETKSSKTGPLLYKVYTDGSAIPKPEGGFTGGYAAVVIQGATQVIISKGYFSTTVNRMEILAVIATLEEFGPNQRFEIYCDSQYTISCATVWTKNWYRNNWITRNGEMVKNKDLLVIMHELLKINKVKFIKVKSHSGDILNDLADVNAREAARNPTTIDQGFAS